MERETAMKILKELHNKSLFAERTALETLIPELKESEDEKIRKALVRFHKSTIDIDGIKGADILAWLEKQGKEKSWKPSKEEMDVLYGLAYITNQYDEHKEEVITRLYQDLKREFFNGSSYENMFPNTSTEDDVRRRSTIQVLEYARSLDTYNQYGKADIDKNIAWLEKQYYTKKDVDDAYLKGISDAKNEFEKQGEQKPAVTDFNAKDWYVSKVDGKIHDMTYNPTDKVESKFHKGDWITCEGLNTALIVNIDYDKYEVELIDGNKVFPHIDYIDRLFHLFTIKDAKDGDVLIGSGNVKYSNGIKYERIYLFNNFDNAYFTLTKYSNHVEEYDIDVNVDYPDNTVPATKKQKEILFMAMKEAGYEWNAEKKELKKIEEDGVEYKKHIMSELVNLAIAGVKQKSKPTWSDEDEERIKNIFSVLDVQVCWDGATGKKGNPYQKEINWLKSLKDRVQSQPKQEWSEEDMSKVQRICKYLDEAKKYYADITEVRECMDWLKSLKDRIGG